MAYGGLLDILQGILGQQGAGQGYGQGQDQGSGLLAMMQQQQQGIPNQLATDDVRAGTGILSGGYGTDRLLGAGSAPASFGTGITGGGVDDNGLPAAAPAGAGAATATAAPLAPASSGGSPFSGLSGAGASNLFSGLQGKAGGLSQWVQNNPGTIDALATGFANIGNKNVGNPFLYGANQAADELKEQVKGDAMKAALQKLGYPAELAAAGGKIPAMGTAVITNALKPKETKPELITYTGPDGREAKAWAYPGQNPAQGGVQVGAPKPALSVDEQLKYETGLRGEVQKGENYKRYQIARPIYDSLVSSVDTNSKASDMNFVYGVASIFDPNSVVRTEEGQMVRQTGSLPASVMGAWNGLMGGATLDATTRRALLAEARSRLGAYETSFNRDMKQYRGLAGKYGIDPDKIIPQFDPLPGVPAAQTGASSLPAGVTIQRVR